MIIYLSLTLLLDGVRRFLVGQERVHTTCAVGSSFSLTFRRGKDGSVETVHEGVVIDHSSPEALAAAAHQGAERFARAHLPLLPEDDAGREDLVKSLAEFGAFLT